MSTKSETGSIPEISTQTLFQFINTYKGERQSLSAFLTNCQNALDIATEIQKSILLKFILSRLEGKAQVACSNKIFDNFEELKTFLTKNFGERKHYNHLLLDLQSCKQQLNETVSQFSLRIESCLTDLQSEIHNSDSSKKELPGRIAMTEDLAMCSFILGLNPKISNIVRCRNPKNLNAAINMATEEEKIQNFINNPSVKPKCNICNKIGHKDSDCFLKIKKEKVNYVSNKNQFYQSKTSQPLNKNKFYQPNSSQFNQDPSYSKSSQNPIMCRYCKNTGHDISQCRKRQFNNNVNYKNRSHDNHIKFLETETWDSDQIHNNQETENNVNHLN